jgi:eukaryotic-like serine/threonine-protein kinase
VHRDVKPANLLIEGDGRVKLTDFGVARIQDSGEATRTQGSMVGTLKYMSPEQVQGQKIDSRADLFSTGVVLYQLLTDKRPFDGDNDFSIIHQIIGHDPPPPSSFNAGLPSAIDAVVARALAKNREQRFATASDFATALQSAMRRADDATVIPPADPLKKTEAARTDSRGHPSVPGSGSVPGSTVTQELELVYWKDIKDSSDPEELEGFLARFPEGIYADLARRRLRKLAVAESSPDQTVLSGIATHSPNPDLEATRQLRSGMLSPVVAEPARAGDASFATTIAERPQPMEPALGDVLRTQAMTAPDLVLSTRAENATAGTARKKLPVAVIAAVGAVAAASIVIALIAGRGGDNTSGAALSAASAAASAPAAGPAARALASGGPVAAVPVTATRAVAAARTPASRSSAHKTPLAAFKAKAASAPASEGVRPAAPAPTPARVESRPAAQPLAAPASSPVEQCRDKMFLSREFCLAEQCGKPGTRNHPLCVQHREEIRLREESRTRN